MSEQERNGPSETLVSLLQDPCKSLRVFGLDSPRLTRGEVVLLAQCAHVEISAEANTEHKFSVCMPGSDVLKSLYRGTLSKDLRALVASNLTPYKCIGDRVMVESDRDLISGDITLHVEALVD